MSFYKYVNNAQDKMRQKTRAVFLDRDGVINEIIFHREMGIIDTPFTVGQFRLRPKVSEAIHQINRLGLKAVIVSNQPGVAMRHFTRRTLFQITRKMKTQLERKKARLDGIYYCLHHPEKGIGVLKKRCSCRKPKAGLLIQAAKELNVDLKHSYMIGDSITDVQAGRSAGCKTFLLAHLKCDLCRLMARRNIKPHFRVKNLLTAVKIIKRLEGKRK